MANFKTLAVSVDDTIGHIQLNRPAQLNPLSTICLRELVAAADWFDTRDEVRVVIVHGAGRATLSTDRLLRALEVVGTARNLRTVALLETRAGESP